MNGPKLQDVKRLFALSRNQCAFTDCGAPIINTSGIVLGDIAHIKASSPGGPRYDSSQPEKERHGFANLLLLCATHHRIVDEQSEKYAVSVLREMKRHHENGGEAEPVQNASQVSRDLLKSYAKVHADPHGQIMIGSPGGIQARDITIRTNRKLPPVPLPPEAIGASIPMRSYIEYLNGRYIDYRKNGVNRGTDRRPFFPGTLYKLVISKFGARINLVPQQRFRDVVAFMQHAIDNTIWGRNSRHSNYHSFDEHCARVNGGDASRPRSNEVAGALSEDSGG